MCGILAVLGGPLPVDEHLAGAALDLMRHRGPDDRGTWHDRDAWLGARRLAILDTSERGHQPMVDQETGVVLVFNGEVYNYLELREELAAAGARFTTGSDTEVVLQAYLRLGERCVEHFNGMWGLVLWDPRTRTGLISRDRFGVKPLFATAARGRLSVASEAKALLALYPELRRPDEVTLFEFLGRGRLMTTGRSFFEAIDVVPPASAATVRFDDVTPDWRRFWRFPVHGATAGDDPDGRFAELLEDAVRIRMRSDVPVGVSLSGGLDSTAIVHGASASLNGRGTLTAFTSVFDALPGTAVRDERAWARLASEPYPSVRLDEVPAARDDWRTVLERAVWHLDGPNFSPAVIPLWAIMARAHESGVKVMLEGQGGDELLGGYIHHAALAFLDRVQGRDGRRSGAVSDFTGYARTFGPSTFSLWVVREGFPVVRHAYRSRLGTASTLDPGFVERHADFDVPLPARGLNERLEEDFSRDILPALLHYGDAISSAHSVEARQPFLDYRLVELCATLPGSWKVGEGETKRILRRYLRSIGHEAIGGRTDKLGFPTPIWGWLVENDCATPRSLLLGADARILAYCTRRGIERLLGHTRRSPASGAAHLYRLVATELWLRTSL